MVDCDHAERPLGMAGVRKLRPFATHGQIDPWTLSGATLACTRLTMLNLLLGHHLKAHELSDAEGRRHRDVGGVAAAAHAMRPMRG